MARAVFERVRLEIGAMTRAAFAAQIERKLDTLDGVAATAAVGRLARPRER